MTLSEQLKRYRDINGLYQRDLARKLGCSEAAVSAWEGGREPQVSMRGKINRLLGLPTGSEVANRSPVAIITQARADLAAALNVPVESVVLEMKLTA